MENKVFRQVTRTKDLSNTIICTCLARLICVEGHLVYVGFPAKRWLLEPCSIGDKGFNKNLFLILLQLNVLLFSGNQAAFFSNTSVTMPL